MEDTGNQNIEVIPIDLSSMRSVVDFACRVLERRITISLLMNNAGTMETGYHVTEDGFERDCERELLGTLFADPEIDSGYGEGNSCG